MQGINILNLGDSAQGIADSVRNAPYFGEVSVERGAVKAFFKPDTTKTTREMFARGIRTAATKGRPQVKVTEIK